MVELFANSGNPDLMPHSATSDLGLHYLTITLLVGYNGLKYKKHKLTASGRREIIQIIFCFSMKTYVVGRKYKHLGEVFLIRFCL